MKYTIIKKGTKLPKDFILEKSNLDNFYMNELNREKYIIEMGNEKEDWWFNEYKTPITVEVIGAKILGSTSYHDIRYRLRKDKDEKFNKNKLFEYKMINNYFNKIGD